MKREKHTTDKNSSKRRTFLTTAGAAITTGLAGCSGSGGNGSPSSDNTSDGNGDGSPSSNNDSDSSDGPFGEIAFEGAELTVGINDDSVTRVNAFRDGEEIGRTDVATGASQVTVFSASQSYHGEEVRLVAADSEGNEIGSTTESFAADASVTRIRTQAVKNDRPMTEEAANEYSMEFTTALVTIENTGDGPLFIPRWGYKPDTSVYLTDGIPVDSTVGGVDDRMGDPSSHVLVPAGGTSEVVPFFPNPRHFFFETSGGENEDWPDSVRSMGEWPDGYADGDEVDVPVVIEDDRGEQVEETITVTYSGGMLDISAPAQEAYTPGRVSSTD